MDILHPGPVPLDGWEYETVHVPVGFDGTFKKFAKAFNKAVAGGITKIFDRTHAHPVITGLPKYTYSVYQGYQMNIFQKFRALKRFYYMLDEYDNDIANAIKVFTGGDNNSCDANPIVEGSNINNVSKFFIGVSTMLDKRFETAVESFKYSNEIGEYIAMMDMYHLWVTLTTYVKEDFPTVAALTISPFFDSRANAVTNINRRMQYQLAFTINSLFDMGWV